MVGDAYTKFGNVGAASYLEVKPSAGQELVIHNIYHPADVELRIVDDTSGTESSFLTEAGKSVLTNMYFHVTESQYLRVYNVSGGAINIAVDGVIMKE